jgi:hypothetical protein
MKSAELLSLTRMGVRRNIYCILVGKGEGNRPRRRPRSRENNIKIDLKEIRCNNVKWIHLEQDMGQ